MANRIKGEMTITGPDGKLHKMRLDFNALAEWEDAGVGIDNAMVALQNADKLNTRQLRALFWCGMRQCDPDIDEATAGRVANMDALAASFAAIMPDEGEAPGNGQPNRAARRASKAS